VRGDALRELGRVRDAIGAYCRARACDPRAAGAHANLGPLLVHLGELDAGLEHCRTAVALRPADPVCRANLGLLLLEYGKLDDAMDAIGAVLELNCESVPLADAAGRAWTELGDYHQARVVRSRLRLDPTADEVRGHAAHMHVEAGDPEGPRAC
jgi:tetratricopeptide (TPR) repeat protein